MDLKSLLYISNGNLPSKMAHTIQVAKMAQALSQKIEFELVTGGDILSALKGMDSEFQDWYGLHSKFNLVRLPVHFKVNYPFASNYGNKSFEKLAVLYACLKAPSFVYTRSSRIADSLLKLGIHVLWEKHELLKQPPSNQVLCRLTHENLLGFVTLSPNIAESYTKHGLSADKVLIAHSGVDLQNFLPYQEKAEARQKLSQPQAAKIVLYSGHLYDYKGIPTLLETAHLMPECQFMLVGGWQEDIDRVKAACQEDKISNVELVGHVEQSRLATYLYAADILILPNTKQWKLAETTSPLKLFEYMACRRPIVASALPNIMTVLRDRANALLAEPDEPTSFKEAIATLLNNPSLASSLAERAWQDVQNFTWERRADRLLQFADDRLQTLDGSVTNSRKSLVRYVKSAFN